MRIVTGNIHGAQDASLARIAGEITAFGVDVVCLNEVRRRHGRRLGRLLGLHAYVASSFLGPYGNAIFTNLPVAGWHRLRFARVRRLDRRDAVVIDLADGPTIAAVHLNSLRRDERPRNAAELVRRLPDRSIIAGDMNETAGGPVAEHLSGRFVDACAGGAEPTFPAASPRVRIDQVWVPPGTVVVSCRTAATDASDHRPVVVEIETIP